MPNDLRQDIEQSAASKDADLLADNPAFKYYLTMGGEVTEEEARRDGISEDTRARYNAALNFRRQAEGNSGNTLGQDFEAGMERQGMGSHRVIDPNGEEVIVVGPKPTP